MAVKKTIELEVDLKKAQQDIQDIREQFTDLKKSVESVEDSAKKTASNTAKGFKNLQGTVEKVKKGFSGVALALKSIPVKLAQEAFDVLKDVFFSNQEVADAYAIALQSVKNVFTVFVNFVLDNSDKVVGFFKSIFEDPLQSVKDLGAAIKANIIERFESALEAIGFLGDAIVKVFKGDFAGAAESAKEAGKELIDSVTGVDDSFDKVAEVTKKVASTIKQVTEEAIKGATAQVKLANAAELAAANQERLRITNLQSAEEQRQIRDDVSKDIDVRIKANQELGKILEKGILQEKTLAEVALAAADAALANNEKDIKLQAEQIRALAAVAEIEERLGGQRSEQLVNEISLIQEKLDLETVLLQQKFDSEEIERQSAINLTDNEFKKLEIQKAAAEARKQLALDVFAKQEELLEKDSAKFKEAQKEKNKLVKESNAEEALLDKQLADMKFNLAKEGLNAIAGALNKNSVAAKAALTAEAIMSTYKAATTALDSKPFFPLGLIGFATALTAGFSAVKGIVGTKTPTGAGSSGVQGAAASIPSAQAPAFNVVGSSPLNQIAETLNNQQPVKAFVVSGDVTTAQQLDRNIISESGI